MTGNVAVPVRSTQLSRRFVAVHFRHLAIHQNHIEISSAQRLQGFNPIGHAVNIGSEFSQHVRHDHLVHRIVVRHQHPNAGSERRRAGALRRNRRFCGVILPASRQCLDQRRWLRRLGDELIEKGFFNLGCATRQGANQEQYRRRGRTVANRRSEPDTIVVAEALIDDRRCRRAVPVPGFCGSNPGLVAPIPPSGVRIRQPSGAGRGLLQCARDSTPTNTAFPKSRSGIDVDNCASHNGSRRVTIESRTHRGLTVCLYRTSHRLGQLFGNGQSQAGAAEFACRRTIGLDKRIEQCARFCRAGYRFRCPTP